MDIKKNLTKAGNPVSSQQAQRKIIAGTKQIRKAIASGIAREVWLAENADPALTEPIEALCKQHTVPCSWVKSMTELGKACGIEVGAAAAAAVK